jgi:hypothetical protein
VRSRLQKAGSFEDFQREAVRHTHYVARALQLGAEIEEPLAGKEEREKG